MKASEAEAAYNATFPACSEWLKFTDGVREVQLDGHFTPEQLRMLADLAARVAINEGCRSKLAPDQWWAFCGETDMGQSLPALCTDCGGEYRKAVQNEPTVNDESKA